MHSADADHQPTEEARAPQQLAKGPATPFPGAHLSSLWSPWRVEYYERKKDADVQNFLLTAAQSSDDASCLVVERRKSCFLLMNAYPYSTGHLMVAPYREVAEVEELTDQEGKEMWALTGYAQRLLRKVVKAQGFNIGLNIGEAGGAGVAHHLHLHIVPRWEGDHNFITVLGDNTRIIPEGLQNTYQKLLEAKAELP